MYVQFCFVFFHKDVWWNIYNGMKREGEDPFNQIKDKLNILKKLCLLVRYSAQSTKKKKKRVAAVFC